MIVPRSPVAMSVCLGIIVGLASCSSSSNAPALIPIEKGKVTGTVSDQAGTALDEYVALSFTPVGGSAAQTMNAATSGGFEMELAPGSYNVLAKRPGYDNSTVTVVEVKSGATVTAEVSLTGLPANTYIGSEQCGVCHDKAYLDFRQTGHPYKLNKANGAAPEYPFTSLDGVLARVSDDDSAAGDPKAGTDNTLGTPTSWDDVSYVIGGFHWKARFIDKDGYIVTGSNVQYNFSTDALSGYHDNETDKPYNCGNCHTTGWQAFDTVVNNRRQDNLPGMHGTFAEQGVGCEACHGAGSLHAQTSKAADTIRRADPRSTADYMDGKFAYGQAMSCGDCHTRDGEKDYPTYKSPFDVARENAKLSILPQGGRIAASGGLIKHHEQFDELLGINPDTLLSTRTAGFNFVHGNCVVCHDPHVAGVYREHKDARGSGVNPTNAGCLRCHEPARFEPKNNVRPVGSMKNLTCIECHMPQLAKSAVARTLPNGVVVGDVTSHIFSINLDGPQLTKDGKFSYPYLSFDYACRTCHGDKTFDIPKPIPGFKYHPDK